MAATASTHLPADLRACVSFARWCTREAVDPLKAAELIKLARAAKSAGERHANTGTDATHASELTRAELFTKAAKELGFETTWPGLWPVLRKGGYDVYLPEV
jgi:hypothetical protein